MRGLTHRWTEPKPLPRDGGSSGLGMAPLVARVLRSRGLADPDEIGRFCNPSLKEMHDPSLMPGLERAAERLLSALDAREPIVIYGDYDVDGVSATAILWRAMRAIAPGAIDEGRVRTYIPHRLDEGYGINAEAIRGFAEEGVRVVVSVDCGITAREPALAARDVGVDLIITDHHNAPDDRALLPEAFALVHPRVAETAGGSVYPYGELCGAGVAFKLAWRLLTMHAGSDRVGEEARGVLLDGLALAGLATIADVVPLEGENRVIARHGLARVKHTALVGLGALIEASGLAGKDIGSEEAGFALGPRLNACGRMGHAREAVELLLTDDEERAQELAKHLDKQNRGRRDVEKRTFEEACERVAALGLDQPGSRSIVLGHEGWHPGVVGIVCSRLVGRFGRPSVLLCVEGNEAKGSGRSIDGYNLHGALGSCADLLTRFGGHDMAAGMALRSADVETFAERMGAHALERIDEERLTPALSIDCEGAIEEVSFNAAHEMKSLGPFGRANREPVVLLRGVRVARNAETMGAGGAHLQVRLDAGDGTTIRAIAWRMGEHARVLREGMDVDVACRVRLNRWRGEDRLEVELKDVRVPEAAPSSA